jgi:hypothetical protein
LKVAVAILLAMAVALLSQGSPAAASPTLHRRAIYESEDDGVFATWKRGATVLPEDATGFYRFRDRAQGVKIIAREGEVSGYLLKFGRGISDKGLVLGYLFSDVAADRDQLWFTTRQIHGIWYGFEGQIVQRRGLSQAVDGNYILEGTLTMHDEAQQTTQRDTISLTSAGQR